MHVNFVCSFRSLNIVHIEPSSGSDLFHEMLVCQTLSTVGIKSLSLYITIIISVVCVGSGCLKALEYPARARKKTYYGVRVMHIIVLMTPEKDIDDFKIPAFTCESFRRDTTAGARPFTQSFPICMGTDKFHSSENDNKTFVENSSKLLFRV